jgi:hypothetical protein
MIRSADGRWGFAIVAAFLFFVAGFPALLLTGIPALGWILMPGGMLAFPRMNVGADSLAEVWFWVGAVSSISIWALIIGILLTLIARRRRNQREAV